jgi:hypothetical protein
MGDVFDALDELSCDCDDHASWTLRVSCDGARSEVSTYACESCVNDKLRVVEFHAGGTAVVGRLPKRDRGHS